MAHTVGLITILGPQEGLLSLLIQTQQALTTSFLLHRLICGLQKSRLGLGEEMSSQRQGWGREGRKKKPFV